MLIGSRKLNYEKVSSTNTMALELIASGTAADGMVITGGFQSEGRGQRENRWFSDPLTNLIMSVILKPRFLHPSEQFMISKIISVSIAEALETAGPSFSIKWPNDIYSGGDKIAGILIENLVTGNELSWSVAGIGININQDEFPGDIPNPVSLKNLTGKEHNVSETEDRLCASLDKWYHELSARRFSEIDDKYLQYLYRLGEPHSFISGGIEFSGSIQGVNASGQLIIVSQEGDKREFSFKEVEFTS